MVNILVLTLSTPWNSQWKKLPSHLPSIDLSGKMYSWKRPCSIHFLRLIILVGKYWMVQKLNSETSALNKSWGMEDPDSDEKPFPWII